jgi:hypothetical protein
MPTLTSPRHIKAREDLFAMYREISPSQVSLDYSQLREKGIIISQLDLEEAENFSQYFLPATIEKLASLQHT